MNWLLFHIAGGGAFAIGLGLLFVAILPRAAWLRNPARVSVWLAGLGLVSIVTAAPALSVAAWGTLLVSVAAGVAAKRFGRCEWLVRGMAMAVLSAFALVDAIHRTVPVLGRASARRVAIIGDSLTAGHGDEDAAVKWPALLRDRHGVEVIDRSRTGATTSAAAREAAENPIDAPVVLLEIGGNDLLGGTPSGDYAAALDALLRAVCQPGRQVVMFELPLPPFHDRYGRIQRDLADRHGVALIPKRVLLSVILAGGATIDSIHLTGAGHERMAEAVWAIVGPAMPDE